jgi:hypothetical protein
MPYFRTYNRLYVKGKPIGKVYVLQHRLKATSKESAKRSATRINANWNKIKQNKREGYTAKLVKVKQVSKKGITRNKGSSTSLQAQARRLFAL